LLLNPLYLLSLQQNRMRMASLLNNPVEYNLYEICL
jgi:hypothetical protein